VGAMGRAEGTRNSGNRPEVSIGDKDMSRKHRIAAGSTPTLLAIAVAVALSGGTARAQDDGKKEHAKADTQTLEVITVTAQRREEDVQKVPISITTVEPEQIKAIASAGDD